jgi:hypothetical protein
MFCDSRHSFGLLSRLSWNWRKRSSVKITERTYEEGTEAFHTRRKSSHLEAASESPPGGGVMDETDCSR